MIDTDPRKYSWASDGLDRALWRSSALGLGAWQLLVGVVVAVVLGRVNQGIGVRAGYFSILLAALSWDLLVAGNRLATTTVRMTFLVAVTTFLVMEWRWALPLSWGWAAVGAAAVDVSREARRSSSR